METRKGIVLMVLAMLGFAIADGLIKAGGQYLHTAQIILGIGVIGSLGFGSAALITGDTPFSRNFFDRAVMARGGGELMGTFGIVSALALIPLSTMSAIQQATPLVVSLGAVLLFKETVGWRRWSAILIGFSCVLLIIRPGADSFQANSLYAVLGVIGLSIRDLATRRVSRDISSLHLSAYGCAVLVPLGWGLTLYHGVPAIAFTPGALIYLALISVFSMMAYYTITLSLRLGEISAISPFRYSRLIFALIIAILVFGERPDWQTWIGAFGIMASGVFLLLREGRAKASV